jgi:hypothetical protein
VVDGGEVAGDGGEAMEKSNPAVATVVTIVGGVRAIRQGGVQEGGGGSNQFCNVSTGGGSGQKPPATTISRAERRNRGLYQRER